VTSRLLLGTWLLAFGLLPGRVLADHLRQQLQWQLGWVPQLQQSQHRLRYDNDLQLEFTAGWQLNAAVRLQQDSVQQEKAVAGWWGSTKPALFSLQQFRLKYQQDLHSLTLGRQIIDWRQTDTVSVADVWTVPDYQDLTGSAQQAQPALRWIWHAADSSPELELVYSPAAVAPWLPDGLFALQRPELTKKPEQAQRGVRLVQSRGAVQWSLFGYDGVDLQPALLPASLQLDWFYPSQQVMGMTAQSQLGSWLWRGELAKVRQQMPVGATTQQGQYWQYVIAAEHEWYGEMSQWLLLLQYSDESHRQQLLPASFYPDFGRVFRQQLLGRLQYDPTGDLQSQYQLEWAWQPAQQASLLKLRYQTRLNPQTELQLSWTAFTGSEPSVWGMYRQQDLWQVALHWFF